MATQLLIYETAVPVTQQRHGNWSVETGADYAFSRNVNSVPLLAVEIMSAAAEYPVVFGGTGDAVMPAAILGLRGDENLYLTPEGAWQAQYIPAFVRRYPFVFSSRDEGKTFTLCIDEAYSGCNREGRGQPIFDAEGKPSPYVENVLKFLQHYQAEFQRSQDFCNKLKALNLLEPMQAQISLESGERMLLSGFSAVNRARLKTLTAAALAELAKSDELELIYTHLYSLRNFDGMRSRMAKRAAPVDAPAATAPAAGTDTAPAERPGGRRRKGAAKPEEPGTAVGGESPSAGEDTEKESRH